MIECLSEEDVIAFVQGRLPPSESAGVDQHLVDCQDCRAVVAETGHFLLEQDGAAAPSGNPTATDDHAGGDPARLEPGTKVARYVVEEPVGMGGWGIVYQAYDPELRRKVAIKLLRAERSAPESEGRARLLREAQAMAQLAHPNVVSVYDVGTYQGMVFVVMELIAGETLAEWLRRGGWTFAEILQVFVAAGRGLAAAHAAQLVHRDFKPDNVLIGSDGRVRVTDFGLVRSLASDGAIVGVHAPALGLGTNVEGPVTTLAGTPGYMAPEQFLGKKADPRTDQFNYCVALYQALYQQHPFGAPARNPVVHELAAAVIAGHVQPPPAGAVPANIHEALVRGLSVDPEARFPSMESLIDALAGLPPGAGRPVWRRKETVFVLAGVLLSGLALTIWAAPGGAERNGAFGFLGVGRCGDGKADRGEECDDGNGRDDDGCLGTCRWARCGDGKLRAGTEECDDGNNVEADGCTGQCLRCDGGQAAFVWRENGHCYTRHDEPAPWNSARRTCGDEGGDLVAYYGMETNIVNAGFPASADVERWIGFLWSREKDFAWVTSEPSNFVHWKKGEPSRAGPDQCVMERRPRAFASAATSEVSAAWAVAPCEQPRAFTCEKAPWSVRPADNHAYKAFFQVLNFRGARAACARMGAHLVTLNSDEEQGFVTNKILATFWLGASDERHEGRFEWVTGEPMTFSSFAPGEPDDPDGKHDCLVFDRDGFWHDRECGTARAYVCEID